MSIFPELNYNSSVRDIRGIQFSIQSPDEIRKKSVVHVTQSILFESNGDPVIGGLFDPRMGVLDRGKLCPTDNQNSMFCPGYFGHIEMARPVFFTQFLSIIVKVMKCVCIRCSRLLIPKTDEVVVIIKRKKGMSRLSKVLEYASKMRFCNHDGCNAPKPKSVKHDAYSKIVVTWLSDPKQSQDKAVLKHYLNADIVLKIFKRITDEDSDLLGLSPTWCRPDWLICTVLPVSPPAVRPSVKQYNNVRSEDDITHKLIDIIKTNSTLRNKINNQSIEQVIDDWTNVLQYHVTTLIDNELTGINPATHRSGRPLKTIKQRLKGKDSRIRGNLMGKRVNFSARSVITPDSNISIDQLGVPLKIAKNLTYPEIVTKYNIEELYKYVRNGPEIHPGAKSIKSKNDGKTRRLHNIDRTKISLQYGDIINRHLKDGDLVLFNRQPSLHKMSMMGHRIKVMPGNTFRLNLAACKPYNADFDGDEMNMHVPRSLQTLVELMEIASIKNQIVSPTTSKPIIYPVQDTLVGIYILTQDNIYFTKDEMMNILMKITHFNGIFPKPEIIKPVELWSSRQLLSFIMPDINVSMGNKSYVSDEPDANQNFVKINNGNYTQGSIDKGILTKASKGLVHMIFNDYGADTTQRFLDNVQDIVREYLLNKGFSVGISGLIADDTIHAKMKQVIDKQKKEVQKIIQHVHLNIFENMTGRPNNEIFEEKVRNTLEKSLLKAGKVGIQSFSDNNGFVTMVKAGSKGSEINIAQMIACLGQQSVDGKRIPKGYMDRTLPHYHKYDNSPESRGFVESSFISGLTPQEFFFHAMGGREGLIDTAVKTSETGYIQRKLIKNMEDLKVNYDMSVRNETGHIIQFLYGDDGIDATKMETITFTQKIGKHFINYRETSYKKMTQLFKFAKSERWITYLLPNTIKEMKQHTNYYHQLNEYFKQIEEDRITFNKIFRDYPENKIFSPIDFSRLIETTKNRFDINENTPTDLNPIYIIHTINEFIENIQQLQDNQLLTMFIRFYLSPKPLCKFRRFTKNAFDYILEEIKIKLTNAKVQNGEMVGPIAAQSIGEPSTQMTLNSVEYSTQILLLDANQHKAQIHTIGEYIDTLLQNNVDKIQHIPKNRTQYLELDHKVFIPSCNKNGKITWCQMTAVTKHLPIGNLIRIKTSTGRTITVTQCKSVIVWNGKEIVQKNGSELKIGDLVPITANFPEIITTNYILINNNIRIELDKTFGLLIGLYLSIGTIKNDTITLKFDEHTLFHHIYKNTDEMIHNYYNRIKSFLSIYQTNNTLGSLSCICVNKQIVMKNDILANFLVTWIGSKNKKKTIPTEAYTSNLHFVRGIIEGVFSTALMSSSAYQEKEDYLTIPMNNEQMMIGMANLCARIHIVSEINKNKSPYILKIHQCYFWNEEKKIFDLLHICYDGCRLRKKRIHEKYFIHNDVVLDKVLSIEKVSSDCDYVYDVTVPETLNFSSLDGFNVADTFHFAGVSAKSNVTRGVPRLKEILHISKSIKKPSLTIYLDEEHRYEKEKANMLMSKIELTVIRDIITSTKIYYDPDNYNTNVEEDREFMKLYQEFNDFTECDEVYSPWILRLEFDKEEMMNKNITMDEIHLKIMENNDTNISCAYTDDNYDKMIFRIRLTLPSKTSEINIENDINYLKMFEKNLLDTNILKGVSNINKVTMRKIDSNTQYIDGSYSNKTEWILDTDGINMMKIFSEKGVDYTRTLSNDVIEMNDILGIEAARNTIVKELIDVIEGSGQSLNNRHIYLLAENMTNKGFLMSVDRRGMNASDKGPLAKCSFEETPGMLIRSSLFGDYDNLEGVSANIMVGQVPKCGTGISDILLDEVKYMNMMKDVEVAEEEELVEQLFDEACGQDQFDFGLDISTIGNENIELVHI